MKIEATLYITNKGNMRMLKTNVTPRSNEISVILRIDVPDKFFKRETPVLDLDLPEDLITNPDSQMIASFTAAQIAEPLRIDAQKVTDGLQALIEESRGDDKGETQ